MNIGMLKKDEESKCDLPADLSPSAVAEITQLLRELLAIVFALYIKTKNFHWHMSGRHFRDYHLLLDEQAGQLLAITDTIAERSRKLGGKTIRSIEEISLDLRIKENNQEFVAPEEMLRELATDNGSLTVYMRAAHESCDKHRDVATASLTEVWIDEAERRTWFLRETAQGYK
jgi:starvation-inducible DNA-binding protein